MERRNAREVLNVEEVELVGVAIAQGPLVLLVLHEGVRLVEPPRRQLALLQWDALLRWRSEMRGDARSTEKEGCPEILGLVTAAHATRLLTQAAQSNVVKQ